MATEYTEDQYIRDCREITQLKGKIAEFEKSCSEYESILHRFTTAKTSFKIEIGGILTSMEDFEKNGQSFFIEANAAQIDKLPPFFADAVKIQAWLDSNKAAYEVNKHKLDVQKQLLTEKEKQFMSNVLKMDPQRLDKPTAFSSNQSILNDSNYYQDNYSFDNKILGG